MLAESTAAHTASVSQSSVRISLVFLTVNVVLMNFLMMKSFLYACDR